MKRTVPSVYFCPLQRCKTVARSATGLASVVHPGLLSPRTAPSPKSSIPTSASAEQPLCSQAPSGPAAPIPLPSLVPSTPTSHSIVVLKKLWSSIPCLGLLLKRLKAGSQGDICEPHSLFTTAERGKQPVSVGERMDKRNVALSDSGIFMQTLKGRTF